MCFRLPSLRGPRDLTLGGVPKKVFAPNIPVRKDKSAKEMWVIFLYKSYTKIDHEAVHLGPILSLLFYYKYKTDWCSGSFRCFITLWGLSRGLLPCLRMERWRVWTSTQALRHSKAVFPCSFSSCDQLSIWSFTFRWEATLKNFVLLLQDCTCLRSYTSWNSLKKRPKAVVREF